MGDFNITRTTTFELEEYARENWGLSEKASIVQRHLYARGLHLALIPASFVTTLLDTIIGVGAGIGQYVTNGNESCRSLAESCLRSSSFLLSRPYSNLMLAINPTLSREKLNVCWFSDENKFLSVTKLVQDSLEGYLSQRLEHGGESDSFLHKHVISRLSVALYALANLVSRIADAIICLIPTLASIITAGRYEKVNALAIGTLEFPSVIGELHLLGTLLLKPYA